MLTSNNKLIEVKSRYQKLLSLNLTLPFILFVGSLTVGSAYSTLFAQSEIKTPLVVRRCNDFTVSGKGDHPEWQKANPVRLTQLDNHGKQQETSFKILYSSTGIYVLFIGIDEKITSTFNNDFENLYEGDVFEVFFHPDTAEPIYFEYEISPLEKELVLLITNRNGKFGRWMPFNYKNQAVVKKVHINGGEKKTGSALQSWSAELFFPNSLLFSLNKIPPTPGMRWNANFCRLDYDTGKMTKWSWSPIKVSFHEKEKFFSLRFE